MGVEPTEDTRHATYKKPPAQLPNMTDRSGTRKENLDTDEIVDVVEEYPVRCAVLFGSRVQGAATESSDVDIAVAFEDGLSTATRLERRIELTTALSKALGIDDVDVTDLDRVRPEIGRSVLETGIVLVGDDQMLDEYRERFEREATDESHDDRMRRFDDVLERLEGQV